jgi:hypothetical protein
LQCYGDSEPDIIKGCTGKGNKIDRLMVWQASYTSTGIPCNIIVDYDLRTRYIPLKATVTYDYASDSRVEVEFMSKAEWQRLAQAGQLDKRFRTIKPEMSSAPVQFNIGTAGLKNPILEDQQFHISMSLTSAITKDAEIKKVSKVNLTYPADWILNGECVGGSTNKPTSGTTKDGTQKYLEWEPTTPGGQTIVCYFKPLNDPEKTATSTDKMGGVPSKTYIVTASAEYTFSRSKFVDVKVEFGGFCCPNTNSCKENCPSKDCLEDQYCTNNACVTGKTTPNGGSTTADTSYLKGYCSSRLTHIDYKTKKLGCLLGMGGCTVPSDCAVYGESVVTGTQSQLWKEVAYAAGIREKLVCRDTGYTGIQACCYESGTLKQCKAAFEEWMRQAPKGSDYFKAPYYYPDEKRIHEIYDAAK